MKKMFFLAAAFACAIGLVSCGDNGNSEENLQFEQFNLTTENPLTIEVIEHDPTASYPVAFTLKLENGNIVAKGGNALPTEEALSHNLPNNPCSSTACIADYGKVKSLEKISKYPDSTEFAANQIATLEHGYVIEAHGSHNINSYNIDGLRDPESVYMRIYLEEEIENGYKIRYEVPFVVE